jgi:pSer/pThr/pTyr-binding forkhead associated (FHA) protein
MVPDIDLTPYGADDKGVSRLHASLHRQEETLVLSDLGSVNHTFINGQRLHAHEVRVLRDGDEIRLGRLVLYAYFRES